jgi:uncharacterized protein YndB with AHSA1/START domain
MNQMIFQSEIVIDAPLSRVWQLVATEKGLRQWWGNTIHLEAKEGGRCEEWRAQGDRISHWRGAVTLYAPPSQLTFSLRAEDALPEEPQMATIHITLQAEGSQTRVQVTHHAFAAASTIEPERPRTMPTLPRSPQGIPMAQLDRPAPGSVPMPHSLLDTGSIAPSRRLVPQPESDALTAMWEARITSLAACAIHA